ncbi:hypothetical protein BCS96_02805 [Vibrio breoganii]|uniref:hypothetical protein n=1 Tax=Vibrio breoganii TaxID=553239 RepID=UPI000C816058|nr:hypothetical protein [Vibrio breoganii]PML85835.1 hypothetical protein BCT68_06120 [Vibrio breoganii]PMP03682.1 hypothetical protein BCS96_02805 [Vibrio breoganii]
MTLNKRTGLLLLASLFVSSTVFAANTQDQQVIDLSKDELPGSIGLSATPDSLPNFSFHKTKANADERVEGEPAKKDNIDVSDHDPAGSIGFSADVDSLPKFHLKQKNRDAHKNNL